MNKKIHDDILYKNRSANGIINSSLQLIAANFKKIFLYLLPSILVFSLFTSFFAVKMITDIPIRLYTLLNDPLSVAPTLHDYQWQIAVIVLTIAAGLIISLLAFTGVFAAIIQMLRSHADQDIIPQPKLMAFSKYTPYWRVIKAAFFTALIAYIPPIIAITAAFKTAGINITNYSQHPYTLLLITLILILWIAVMLPLIYPLSHYLLHPKGSYFALITKKYAIAMRYWGLSFKVILVVLIIIGVSSCIIGLPTMILSHAQSLSLKGILIGDPSGMPGYINILSYVVYALVFAMHTYIQMLLPISCYYLYGSITEKEREKENYKTQEYIA